MAVTVTPNTLGRTAGMCNVAAVKVTIDANSVSYATSLGGLALDLYAALAAAGPFSAPPNGNDVFGIQATNRTSGGFIPTGLTLGTVTSTSIPCFIRLMATGTSGSAGFAEIADGACTQTFSALILVARNGTN